MTRCAIAKASVLLIGIMLYTLPLACAQTTGSDSGMIIESHSVVFNYPNTDPYDRTNFYGFNHAPSVTMMSDGRLLCVWFSGPFEGSVHQVLLAAFSDDKGKTWGKAFVIQDEPHFSDFDPAFVVADDKVWLFYIVGRWNTYPALRTPEGERGDFVGKESYHLFMRLSQDSGKTWTPPELIHPTAGSRSNGIELSTGELLLPVHDLIEQKNNGVLKSTDRGQTWRRTGDVINVGIGEPSIAELKNGNILMVLRTRDGHLWTSVSEDKGETWQPVQKQDMIATSSSHSIYRLHDGRIALTHNPCKPGRVRSPLTIRLSDDGYHWGKSLVLDESLQPGADNDYWSCQVCYPSVYQLEDEAVIVVYTEINVGNLSQYGNINCIRIKLME